MPHYKRSDHSTVSSSPLQQLMLDERLHISDSRNVITKPCARLQEPVMLVEEKDLCQMRSSVEHCQRAKYKSVTMNLTQTTGNKLLEGT
jgi:hypothetical protein